jgi:CheY-specific phosphatase CheX
MIQCDTAVKSAIVNAVTETMENMAFEQVEESVEATATPAGDLIWASMPVIRPSKAEISIELSNDYAKAVTEALFGFMENGPDDNIVRDALAEMLNTIGGRFMAQLTPAKQEFELGLPTVGAGKSKVSPNDSAAVNFNVGEHILRVYISGLDPQKGSLQNTVVQEVNNENISR